MSLQNTWHHRKVADTAAKACLICYKPSTSVLITPDNKKKDFFYTCPAHLKDRNFCSPIVDTAGQEAKKKQESMAAEIEKVKKEYEEKQKKKKEKEKEKKKESEDSKDKSEKDKDANKGKDGENENAKSDEKERDEKVCISEYMTASDARADFEQIKSIQKQENGQGSASPSSDDSPRVFSLHKNFYQMRVDRLRGIEVAKKNRQRMQDPSLFPSVPSGGV